MTDLQLGLLVIGAAAVAGVLVYNRVQERATRREAQRAFGSAHADVLLDKTAPRREPSLEAPPRRGPPQVGGEPNARIDYVIDVEGAAPAEVRAQWTAIEHRFANRATLSEAEEGRLEAALQMVNRSGVIGEAELLEFRSQVETIAAAHGATVSAPEMRQALEAAHTLDRACAELDVQIALHVLGASAAQGEDQPFQVAPRADGTTFLLDLPRTPDLARSYAAMAKAAQQLGGRLVDDNGNSLDERALAAIGAEVEAIRARFAEMGIEPGSPLALRLFS